MSQRDQAVEESGFSTLEVVECLKEEITRLPFYVQGGAESHYVTGTKRLNNSQIAISLDDGTEFTLTVSA